MFVLVTSKFAVAVNNFLSLMKWFAFCSLTVTVWRTANISSLWLWRSSHQVLLAEKNSFYRTIFFSYFRAQRLCKNDKENKKQKSHQKSAKRYIRDMKKFYYCILPRSMVLFNGLEFNWSFKSLYAVNNDHEILYSNEKNRHPPEDKTRSWIPRHLYIQLMSCSGDR